MLKCEVATIGGLISPPKGVTPVYCQRPTAFLALFVFAILTSAHAQYEIPEEIFQRTVLIRSNNEQATAFKFDHGGRIYWVTTRHLGNTLPPNNAVIQVWHNRVWTDLQTVRTLFPASKDVDLAILETDEKISRPYTVANSSEVLTTGQKVWLIGWFAPFELPKMPPNMPKTSRALFPEIPNFVKIGEISVIDPTQPASFQVPLKPLRPYSPQIAAGPIIYWSPAHKDFEILGLIKREKGNAVTNPFDGRTEELVKSGVVKVYSFDLVVEAIRATPH